MYRWLMDGLHEITEQTVRVFFSALSFIYKIEDYANSWEMARKFKCDKSCLDLLKHPY